MQAKTHFKLGLFTLVAIGAVLATLVGLGWRTKHTATTRYETYFDESVQGLDLGAPVKFRGVTIGTVSEISIAPDHRFVAVALRIMRREARRLDLARVHLDMRASLSIQGVTGVKFIDLDLAGAHPRPPPLLSFPTSEHYIPSRPSLLAGLSANAEAAVRDLPAVVGHAASTLRELDAALTDVRAEHLPSRLGTMIDAMTATSNDARALIAQFRRGQLPDRVRGSLAKLDHVLAALDGTEALVASARRATEAIGDIGRSSRATREELDRTLDEIADAARAFRDLVDTLEREPDMLVKGRNAPRSR